MPEQTVEDRLVAVMKAVGREVFIAASLRLFLEVIQEKRYIDHIRKEWERLSDALNRGEACTVSPVAAGALAAVLDHIEKGTPMVFDAALAAWLMRAHSAPWN